MLGFPWSNEILPVLILSSYLLSSIFPSVGILKKKLRMIKTLITILCCSLSMLAFYFFPEIYSVLVMLAIWGSVEIISSAVNKLNQHNANGGKEADKLPSSRKVLKPLKEDAVKKEPDLLTNDSKDQLLAYQQREKNYLQEISHLNQQLKGYQYQINKNYKKEKPVTQNAMNMFQTVQKPSANDEITSINKMEPNSSVTNDVKLYLNKIDEHKREIENLFGQISKLQENFQSSEIKNTETNIIKPQTVSVSNNSNEVKEYLKQVQQEGAEISPFLRSFLVPPK